MQMGIKMDYTNLIKEAMIAREKSYSPYSNYQVGAALLTKNGKIFTGCNIENAGYTPSNCAERTAFFKAVSQCEYEFKAIAIVGSPKGEIEQYAFPCGVCLQVMMEFCDPDSFQVIIAKSQEEYMEKHLIELLPFGFSPSNLK